MKKLLVGVLVLAVFSGCTPVPVDIVVESPVADSVVSSPLAISGEAKGGWFFEGSFPVYLLDANGEELAASYVTAQSNWMTADFVDFTGSLDFVATTERGTLLFKNDNPSGLAENEVSFEVPVRFGVDEKVLVEDYIRANIGDLNPTAPVLGGSWYVLTVEFLADNQVKVVAEDGHIQSEFTAKYFVDGKGVKLEEVKSGE
ncbi:hypothetical protein KA119_00390 [Candidatus Gracilibacteria bacterium]|nr:hypothetical protein [Candidatus Gracilibacteria bacterium]